MSDPESAHARGGYYVEYAKSGRGACKQCKGLISQDTLRVGKEAKSQWHDGFDMSWRHRGCASGWSSVEELKGWQFLRWDDIQSLRKKVGDSPLVDPVFEKANADLWKMKDDIRDVLKPKMLKDILNENGINTEKVSPDILFNKVADGLLNGLIGECPECEGVSTMHWNSQKYICKGWMPGGFSRCEFQSEINDPDGVVKRWLFKIPEGLKKTNKFLKAFKYKGPTTPFKKGASGVGGAGAGAGAGAEADQAEGDAMADAPSAYDESLAEEDEPEDGRRLFGMRVLFCGSAKDLGGTQAELQACVEKQGGTYVKDTSHASVCVSTEAEVGKKRKTQKLQDALSGIPVMSIEWFDALCEGGSDDYSLLQLRNAHATANKIPKGSKGITAKVATSIRKDFMLNPKKLTNHAVFDKRFDAARDVEETAASDQQEKKRKREEEERRAKQKKHKRPVPGSDVLKVDELAAQEFPASEVFVQNTKDRGFIAFNVMCNLTDLMVGTNKFYKLTLLKKKAANAKQKFACFIKYGRVGLEDKVGDWRIYPFTKQAEAIEWFENKYNDLTGQHWKDRDFFQKLGGRYFVVDLDDGNDGDSDGDEEQIQQIRNRLKKRPKLEHEETPEKGFEGGEAIEGETMTDVADAVPGQGKQEDLSDDEADVGADSGPLDPRLSALIELIFDKKMMQKTLSDMQVDVKKMPLGKIKKSQVLAGYSVLSQIAEVLQTAGSFADGIKNRGLQNRLRGLSNEFYTKIPHDFGKKNAPVLDNDEAVKSKMEMLEALMEMEVAQKLGASAAKSDHGAGLTEEQKRALNNYQSLNCELVPLDPQGELYQLLKTYCENSQDDYFNISRIEVLDIYEMQRAGETERYEPFADFENRHLLWHGSRLANWCGILSQGMRIAPPEAPKTGYRFGKGAYFADAIMKSGIYCRVDPGGEGVMMLCEVAMGTMNELLRDKYMDKAMPGTHSTKAMGNAAPDPAGTQFIDDEVIVPAGKIQKNVLPKRSACSHNEFIVYDVAQIKCRYAFRMRFH